MQGVLGAKLRKARTELGLSQAAFARALGFSSEFISLLEADKRAPSLTTLNKIAAYLKKDLRDFLQEKEGGFNILLRGDVLSRAVGVLQIVGAKDEVEKDEILTRSLRTPKITN
jgi:transcriptional regulator with XRE-family HTH domain